MRRSPRGPVLAAVTLTVALVACGDDDSTSSPSSSSASASSAAATATTTPDDSVVDMTLVPQSTVPAPEVDVPETIPIELVVTEITPGSGPAAAEGDTVLVHYVGVRSEDGTEFDSNFGGSPFPVTLGQGGVIAGWDQGLVGVTAGERLQLDIPADLAYGDEPQGEVIQAGDALTFVIDVRAVVPASDPADAPTAADIPLSDEPVEDFAVEDITVGDGATLDTGMTAVLHLVAARGDDGTILESTWENGQPQTFVVAPGQLLDGLVEGLPGMQVGGRRAVTIPYDPAMGLTPETNVVIIADLLATF
jgi:FKBP-type peptidyl-prolyl cis-trans isomerase